ncbi:MAG: DUF2125 domain-containing protein [Acetobacteraceae bacterium]
MRRLILIFLGVLLLLGAADALAWAWATARLARQLAAWEAAQRAHGWHIAHAAPERAGFPLAARLILPRWRVFVPLGPTRARWRAGRLVLTVPPLLPPRLIARAEGPQRLSLPGLPELHLHATELDAAFRLTLTGRPAAATLHLRGLRTDPGTAAPGLAVAALDARITTPAHRLRLSARGLVLPRTRRWPLGRQIAAFALRGRLAGTWPRTGSLSARLAAWRHRGGALRIARLALHWGRLRASLTARLRLDAALRPAGTATLRLWNGAAALDTLAANGAITNDDALAAKAVLSLVSQGRPNGPISVPLVLRDGRLEALGVGILPLPPLAPP